MAGRNFAHRTQYCHNFALFGRDKPLYLLSSSLSISISTEFQTRFIRQYVVMWPMLNPNCKLQCERFLQVFFMCVLDMTYCTDCLLCMEQPIYWKIILTLMKTLNSLAYNYSSLSTQSETVTDSYSRSCGNIYK